VHGVADREGTDPSLAVLLTETRSCRYCRDVAVAGPAQRALSFGTVADAYDRFRPGPPRSAVEWILRSNCGIAADIGAGTGAFTRRLSELADSVVAIEPDARMLAVLRRSAPSALAIRGRAEQLPVGPASLDAAMVSSAWHWMDPQVTVAELGRVLRPGGILGIVSNGADRSVEWVNELLGPRNPASDRGTRPSRRDFVLPAGSPFVDLESELVSWSLPMTGDQLVGLAGTYSSTITLAPRQRERELARVRAVAESISGTDPVGLPMRCRCWRAVRE